MYGLLYPFNPGRHYDLISRLLSIVVLGGLGSTAGSAPAHVIIWWSADGRVHATQPSWSR